MKSQKISPSILWHPLLILAMGIILFGCQTNKMIAEETIIPFETIEKKEHAGTGDYYEAAGPKLFIIADVNDVIELGNTISISAQTDLQNLDFEKYVAFIVFRGKVPDIVDVEIQKITQKENELTIHSTLFRRDPNLAHPDTVLSPYHIIKFPRNILLRETIFILDVEYLPELP